MNRQTDQRKRRAPKKTHAHLDIDLCQRWHCQRGKERMVSLVNRAGITGYPHGKKEEEKGETERGRKVYSL